MKVEVVDVGVYAVVGSRVSAENICTVLVYLICHDCKTVKYLNISYFLLNSSYLGASRIFFVLPKTSTVRKEFIVLVGTSGPYTSSSNKAAAPSRKSLIKQDYLQMISGTAKWCKKQRTRRNYVTRCRPRSRYYPQLVEASWRKPNNSN